MTRKLQLSIISLICLVTFILALGCAPPPAGRRGALRSRNKPLAPEPKFTGPKKRVAVIEFENKTDYGRGKLGTAAADMMVTALVKSGAFEVIERNQLKNVLAEQGLGMSGTITSASAAKAARLLGVQVIVVGSITEFGSKQEDIAISGFSFGSKKTQAVVDCRLIDTASAKILMAETASSSASQGRLGLVDKKGRNVVNVGSDKYDSALVGKVLRGAINQLVGKIRRNLANIPWRGEILKVAGGTIIIKGGTDVGIKPGDLFEVIGQGEVLVDSSGNEIVLPGSKKGEIQAVNVFENAAKAIKKAGLGFEKGDTIVIKPKPEAKPSEPAATPQ